MEDWETSLDNAEDPKDDCGVIGESGSGVSGARLTMSVEAGVWRVSQIAILHIRNQRTK